MTSLIFFFVAVTDPCQWNTCASFSVFHHGLHHSKLKLTWTGLSWNSIVWASNGFNDFHNVHWGHLTFIGLHKHSHSLSGFTFAFIVLNLLALAGGHWLHGLRGPFPRVSLDISYWTGFTGGFFSFQFCSMSHADQCCVTGTIIVETVTFCLSGTGSGTGIKLNHKKKR